MNDESYEQWKLERIEEEIVDYNLVAVKSNSPIIIAITVDSEEEEYEDLKKLWMEDLNDRNSDEDACDMRSE